MTWRLSSLSPTVYITELIFLLKGHLIIKRARRRRDKLREQSEGYWRRKWSKKGNFYGLRKRWKLGRKKRERRGWGENVRKLIRCFTNLWIHLSAIKVWKTFFTCNLYTFPTHYLSESTHVRWQSASIISIVNGRVVSPKYNVLCACWKEEMVYYFV